MHAETDTPDVPKFTAYVDHLLREMRQAALNADPKFQNLNLASLFALLIQATTTMQLANRSTDRGKPTAGLAGRQHETRKQPL